MLSVTWAVGVRVGRHSVVDVVWGSGFALVAVVSLVLAAARDQNDTGRQVLVTALTVIWGVRLAVHIARRNHGKGEDPRYAEIKDRAQGNPEAHVYRRVYLTQAGALWFVSLPVQLAMYQGGPLWSGVSLVPAVLGFLVWVTGFLFEAVGDRQLQRFTSDLANKGEVNDRGLWRYTRHANYFGDACVWWGLFLLAASRWSGPVFVLSPLLMTWALAQGTGAPTTEKRMRSSRRGYAEYVGRTSGFVPMPPRKPAGAA